MLTFNDALTLKPVTPAPKYKAYNLSNFEQIPQVAALSEELRFEMRVVGNVFPFKTNNYVVDELIDWSDVPNDPIFVLTFPQRGMLNDEAYEKMANVIRNGGSRQEIKVVADEIRLTLNPHPAGQLEYNVPELAGEKLNGMQHKYKETVLFFPSQGQTCHAYCSFCFRWPQFVGMTDLKFASREAGQLVDYLGEHPEVTDVLFTGGDPMIMKSDALATYFRALLKADLPEFQTIRIGTKALGYWPYRFTSDADADEVLELFEEVIASGKHIALMAHFNHPRELETPAVQEAIARIRATGAEIRTQSPVLTNINDSALVWSKMWAEQVRLGLIPYYMFVVRDTGAQDYFGITLSRAWEIYHNAIQSVSGLARTVRGPSMSATPGKVHVLGTTEVHGEKVFALQFLQGRNPDWVTRPFFAKYDENAIWLDDLKPAFGEERFFFEENSRN
ncbi:MAG: lysine 2,3-aminomutase [Candidatus Eisenbacteria bacterium]|uniref:Lysine 2,3-aminomutase n=1 Tax=Eiseniibacteriota bacterium TaxID=2212470 RepID=A0A7Y2H195_UNCEI|nr:lysine 2,3-aminomutase [Candidatus Eisenbacteria bacterium]